MKILVVGSGGREHAIAWKVSRDSSRPEIFCAPGNAGTSQIAVNLPIAVDDINGIAKWARANKPDLVIVGPEAPLCDGLVDNLSACGIKTFGPLKSAAMIEGSKVFSKEVMIAADVPTAHAKYFTNANDAFKYTDKIGGRVVIKAEGLAAGKGVIVCNNILEAKNAIKSMLEDRTFGTAGERILVEEYLEGEEASILALVDGKNVQLLASAQDHKRVYDNDTGPNTGGMGAYSPAPVVTEKMMSAIRERVFERTISELRRRNIIYKGVLYAGLMIDRENNFKVLEFNCRFGDPETQAILPRIDGDILPTLFACVSGEIEKYQLHWSSQACVSVVMASGGYPGKYEKGKVIEGIKDAEGVKDVIVFHAGTALKNGKVVTAGGRVLNVTALAADIASAAENAYKAVAKIHFEGCHYRKDIASRAIKRR